MPAFDTGRLRRIIQRLSGAATHTLPAKKANIA
jgi:hypothetical protein